MKGDLLQQLAEARAMNEDLQAQLDMASGSFLEFERAEENLTLMETQIGDLDQTTQNYVRAMISEYRRLKLYEEETRHQSRTFASKQNRTDWEKAASNLKAAAIELNNYQAMPVVQRNQVARNQAAMNRM